jgi:hypothetical protein
MAAPQSIRFNRGERRWFESLASSSLFTLSLRTIASANAPESEQKALRRK